MQAQSVPPPVFDTILARVYADLKRTVTPAQAKAIAKQLTAMRADGSWPDIDYASTAITTWQPGTHLARLQDFATACAQQADVPGWYKTLYPAIVAGLRYWYAKDPKSGNWWHNEIRSPQAIGEILITMRFAADRLPASLEDSLITRMQRGNIIKMTGANKLDVAIHFLYRALLTGNDKLMDTAVQQAFQPVQFTTEEGLQHDYSYLQHGPQLQLSSYGAVFLAGEFKVAKYVRGTPYALSDAAQQRLSNYLDKTYLRTIRGKYIDFNVEGRGISRPNVLSKQGDAGLLEDARLVDPARSASWFAAMARISGKQPEDYQVEPAHTHFWRADYTMHNRAAYNFNVRLVSTRTNRTESGNKENLYGRYLPDGSTNIQVKGDEYYNIMPLWEWDKIPGTTSADHAEDVLMDKFWGELGSTSFAGGVSDSIYGATAYDMNYDGVKAKKAWFFFDNEVVCLGAGINGTGNNPVVTTLNQCWLNGNVQVDKKKLSAGKQQDVTNPSYIWHNDLGFYFPGGGNVVVSTAEQKGNWYHINNSHSKNEITGNVFKLWFNHGAAPVNGKYAYVVVPGKPEAIKTSMDQVKIIANTDVMQAVKHLGLNMLQVVFYQPGTLTDGDLIVTVDKPCVVLLKKINGKNIPVSIADPSQTAAKVTLTVKTKALVQPVQWECALPQGVYAGSTTSFILTGAKDFVAENFSFAAKHLKNMLVDAAQYDTLFPRTIDKNGKLVSTERRDWTGGFFPGSLWYTYEHTKDKSLKDAAIKWTEKLEPLQFFNGHHDVGFLMYCSYGNAYRLTGDAGYAKVLVQTARSLCTRFDDRVGVIKSWNSFSSWHGNAVYNYPVIIDNMMNLELLFFASKFSGDPRYREVAIKHAESTMKNQVRDDHSCYHVVCYDTAGNRVLARETAQGYSDNSAWSRGQAWGIYGFTVVYRETKDPRFLECARKMADFYLKHTNLPADKVPYWDFNVNQPGYVPGVKSNAKAGLSPELRDASAAAVTASALFELSTYLGKEGDTYFKAGEAILHSLAGDSYRAELGTNGNFILKHSVGSIPHGFELDVPLVYADYYFIEALGRYDALVK
ncbi:MAG TPA: polysaccharide lyase family 8 super-sandwich domain-containing protein [Niastella sp.]